MGFPIKMQNSETTTKTQTIKGIQNVNNTDMNHEWGIEEYKRKFFLNLECKIKSSILKKKKLRNTEIAVTKQDVYSY